MGSGLIIYLLLLLLTKAYQNLPKLTNNPVILRYSQGERKVANWLSLHTASGAHFRDLGLVATNLGYAHVKLALNLNFLWTDYK